MDVHVYIYHVIMYAPSDNCPSKPRIFTRVPNCLKHKDYLFASIWSRSLLTVLTLFSNCILKPFNAEAFMLNKYSNQNTERRKSHVTLTVFHDLFVGWKTLDRVKRYVDHRVPLHVHVTAPAPWMEGSPSFPPNSVVPISAWTPHLFPWSAVLVELWASCLFLQAQGDSASPVEADTPKNLNENETGLIFTLAQPQ